jgi:hypothetical protein
VTQISKHPQVILAMYFRLFEICFHFVGHRSSTQEFSAEPSEFLPDLHCFTVIIIYLNKNFKNYVLNLVSFSKFEGIPSWIWLLFFGAWFQLFGLFWMVTGLPIFMINTLPCCRNCKQNFK